MKSLQEAHCLGNIFDLLQGVAEEFDVVGIVYHDIDFALEDTVVGFECDTLDDKLGEFVQHIRDSIEHTVGIDTLDTDGSVEKFALVHVPTRGYDVVAVARLEFRGMFATARMKFEDTLRVDVSHDVVAGNRMTTGGDDTFIEHFLVDNENLLAVKALGEISIVRSLRLLLLATDEGDVLAPATSALLATEIVQVVITQRERGIGHGEIEVFTPGQAVVGGETVSGRDGKLHVVVGQECLDHSFTLLLLLAVLAAQDGLNLALGLGRGGKSEPFGLHILSA